MNRSTEQLRDWMSRMRRMIKKAATVTDSDEPRWCPEITDRVQLELELGVAESASLPVRARRRRTS